MGNACGCAEGKTGEAGASSIAKAVKQGSTFTQQGYQSKIVPSTFSPLSPRDKDILLAEILRIVVEKGDVAKVKPSNANIKSVLAKSLNKFTLPTGEQYEGDIIDGSANGKGRVNFASTDGSVFEGNFANGYEQGQGQIRFKNGDTLRCDTFCNANPYGLAQYTYADRSEELQCYDKTGHRSGPYTYIDKQGTVYYGQYRNDKEDGFEVRIPKTQTSISAVEYKTGIPGPERTYSLAQRPSFNMPTQGGPLSTTPSGTTNLKR